MPEQEYDDYTPEHPDLIPKDGTEAHEWIQAAVSERIAVCDTQTFLRAWWAFAWINPGFHPDDYENFIDLPLSKELTEEAIRRVENDEINGDGEFYAAEAAHNAVWLEHIESPNAPSQYQEVETE